MLNREIYNKLPSEKPGSSTTVSLKFLKTIPEAAQSVPRYELETFVCDGQYEKGIEVVLDKFLHNLGSRNEQPGILISGFYGSGKSHLAKCCAPCGPTTSSWTARPPAALPNSPTQLQRT